MLNLNTVKIKKEIERRNKLFKGARPAKKRVLIAQDVIDGLIQKRILAHHGGFVVSDDLQFFDEETLKKGDSTGLRELLLSGKIPPCKTCALGAMMVSCTLFNNKEKLSDFEDHFSGLGWNVAHNEILPNEFNKFFSREQLILIEMAFEGGMGYFQDRKIKINISMDNRQAAIDFGLSYEEAGEPRLIGIMQNIIENKGTFKPSV